MEKLICVDEANFDMHKPMLKMLRDNDLVVIDDSAFNPTYIKGVRRYSVRAKERFLETLSTYIESSPKIKMTIGTFNQLLGIFWQASTSKRLGLGETESKLLDIFENRILNPYADDVQGFRAFNSRHAYLADKYGLKNERYDVLVKAAYEARSKDVALLSNRRSLLNIINSWDGCPPNLRAYRMHGTEGFCFAVPKSQTGDSLQDLAVLPAPQ